MFKILTLMTAVLFTGQLAAEKIYKWVDDKGQIHYSSKKPVGQEAETMKLKKAPKAPAKTVTESDDQAKNKDEENKDVESADAKAKAKAKAEAAAQLAEADKVNNKKQCDLATKNYAALNATVRVSRKNAQGETVRMTDDERVNALQTAQQAMKQYCQ